MEEQKINKKITFSVVAVLLIVLVTIGATYAYFSAQAGTDVQTVTTGTLTMGFTNGDIVNATGITPIADSEIKTKATSLPFSVTNTGNQHTKITIKLTDITIDDALKDVDFRWGLYNADTDKGVSFGIFKYSQTGGEKLLLRDVVLDSGSPAKNYILRVWIHDNGDVQNNMQGKTFSAKVTVTGEAVEYTDESCFDFDNGSITGYNSTCGEDVVIPKTIGGVAVTQISAYEDEFGGYHGAFYHRNIRSVVIPEGVTTITKGSFVTSGLKYLTIPESVTTISENAFENVSLDFLAIPESNITFSIAMPFLRLEGEQRELVIPGTIKLTSLDFVNSIVGDIILMEGLTTIPNGTFNMDSWYNDSVRVIEIPSSVSSIGQKAFGGLRNLIEIVIRGKSSLDDFTDSTGLTAADAFFVRPDFKFRP